MRAARSRRLSGDGVITKLKAEPGQQVIVSILSDAAVKHPARIVRLAGEHLELAADWTAPAGVAVKVEWQEYVVLGELVPSGDTAGRLTIAVRHWLDLAQLSPIRKTWRTSLGEPAPR